MELKEKIVLITGGVVRIGRTIALEMLNNGAQVFCHYFSSEDKAKDLQNQYPQIQILKGDLRNFATAEKLIDQLIEIAGTIDVLINNAGIFYKTPFGEVTEKNWDDLVTLNLKAAFFLSQAAGKIMKNRGTGKIVNIADTCAEHPWPSYIPYSISKGGIITMTKGLAKVLAPEVQVNAISPGPVLLPDEFSQIERNRSIEKTLLKREGKSEDIASTVRFLIEDGDYITGNVIAVDGGRNFR